MKSPSWLRDESPSDVMGALKPHDHFGGIIVPVLLQTRARTKCHLEQELPGSFLIYKPFSSLFAWA